MCGLGSAPVCFSWPGGGRTGTTVGCPAPGAARPAPGAGLSVPVAAGGAGVAGLGSRTLLAAGALA